MSDDPECVALKALASTENAASTVIELFVARGDDRAAVAKTVVSCLTAQDELAPDEQVQAVCDVASGLIDKKAYQDAYDLLTALRATDGNGQACETPFNTAKDEVAPTTNPAGLGGLWSDFDKDVLQPLSPVLAFVGIFSLVLLGIGRLLVLFGIFWNARSSRAGRALAWGLGVVLALFVPAAFALRGIWLMRETGPLGRAIPGSPALLFVDVAWGRGWQWWALLVGAIASVLLFAFAFATTRRARVTLKSNDDGSSVDSTGLMAAISALAGGPGRGLEFPVGTDVSTAADTVSKLSENRFFAAIQAVVKAIFSSSPWDIVIENQSPESVSLAISRNGRLQRARRLALADHPPLVVLKDPPKPDLLAALAAGEIVGVLQDRYPSEMRPGLHGGTDPAAIALQFIASSELIADEQKRAVWIPTLQRAARLDPLNRAVSVTLWYVEGRFDGTELPVYASRLNDALKRELEFSKGHGRRVASLFELTNLTGAGELAWRTPKRRLRRNDLLVRIGQSLVACERNLRAAGVTPPSDTLPLLNYLLELRQKRSDPPVIVARRRAMRAVSIFVEEPSVALVAPTGLYPREKQAWDSASTDNAVTPVAKRLAHEAAVLDLYGDFRNSPEIAYNYACRISVREAFWDPAGYTLIKELLRVGLQRRSNLEWAKTDPELGKYRDAIPFAWAKLIADATPESASTEPEPETLAFDVLLKRVLGKMAKA